MPPEQTPPPAQEPDTSGSVVLDDLEHGLDAWFNRRIAPTVPLVGGARRRSLALVVLMAGTLACNWHYIHHAGGSVLSTAAGVFSILAGTSPEAGASGAEVTKGDNGETQRYTSSDTPEPDPTNQEP